MGDGGSHVLIWANGLHKNKRHQTGEPEIGRGPCQTIKCWPRAVPCQSKAAPRFHS